MVKERRREEAGGGGRRREEAGGGRRRREEAGGGGRRTRDTESKTRTKLWGISFGGVPNSRNALFFTDPQCAHA